MIPEFPFSARAIAALHDRSTAQWHQSPEAAEPHDAGSPSIETFLDTVHAQHRANFDLWHTEDRARAPRATPEEIVEVKRAIDHFNQRRNDLAEQCDVLLLEQAIAALRPKGGISPTAQLHSESPGLMIDRLSILALKIYHTREEIDRPDAPSGHRDRNRERLSLLTEQRGDLIQCLDHLWQEILAGQRRFKIYRQLKMYNDPALNPAIYGSKESE